MTKKEALEILDNLQESFSNLMNHDYLDWESIEAIQIAKETLRKDLKRKEQEEKEEMNKVLDDLVNNRTDPRLSKTPINLEVKNEYGRKTIVTV